MHTAQPFHLQRKILCIIVLWFALFTNAVAACDSCVFPLREWQQLTPSEHATFGWVSEDIDTIETHLRNNTNATGVMVIDSGRVVLQFGDVQGLSYIASVRKSVLAILYGFWVDNKLIDLDATLEALDIDDVGGLLPIERKATLRDLITARSGVYHPASNTGDDTDYAPPRGSKIPGTYMLYNNWDFNAAGGLFELLTGSNLYDELALQLAGPLQFQDWDRERQRKSGRTSKSQFLAYHMWLSTRDMARIGLLMLTEGRWHEQQLISHHWIKKITQPITRLEEMNPNWRQSRYFGYGYMWWVWDGPRAVGPFKGAFTGRGAYGQWISVFPAINMVIAVKTDDNFDLTTSWRQWHTLIELVFAAKGIDMQAPYPWA